MHLGLSCDICLQIGNRVNVLLLQEVIIGDQLFQILFCCTQIRRQQHHIGKLGDNSDHRYDKIKDRIHQNGCGVIAVVNSKIQPSEFIL